MYYEKFMILMKNEDLAKIHSESEESVFLIASVPLIKKIPYTKFRRIYQSIARNRPEVIKHLMAEILRYKRFEIIYDLSKVISLQEFADSIFTVAYQSKNRLRIFRNLLKNTELSWYSDNNRTILNAIQDRRYLFVVELSTSQKYSELPGFAKIYFNTIIETLHRQKKLREMLTILELSLAKTEPEFQRYLENTDIPSTILPL